MVLRWSLKYFVFYALSGQSACFPYSPSFLERWKCTSWTTNTAPGIAKLRSPLLLTPGTLFSSTFSESSDPETESPTPETIADQRNVAYIGGLLDNLTSHLDKYILTGSSVQRDSIYNLLRQIESYSCDAEQVQLARRRIQRAGLPLPTTTPGLGESTANHRLQQTKELGLTDHERRRQEADQRQRWEEARTNGERASSNGNGGRSALSQRSKLNGKPDVFIGSIHGGPSAQQKLASDKVELQKQLENADGEADADLSDKQMDSVMASNKVSEMVAQAGAESGFDGQSLGIGGLDDVLAQVKRRVWIPLAAPPQLLKELGIVPV